MRSLWSLIHLPALQHVVFTYFVAARLTESILKLNHNRDKPMQDHIKRPKLLKPVEVETNPTRLLIKIILPVAANVFSYQPPRNQVIRMILSEPWSMSMSLCPIM